LVARRGDCAGGDARCALHSDGAIETGDALLLV
jgi:hypothetical protein